MLLLWYGYPIHAKYAVYRRCGFQFIEDADSIRIKDAILQLSLTINSLSGTLHLRYGWDPRNKVIAYTSRVMYAKEFVIERCYVFILLQKCGFGFW